MIQALQNKWVSQNPQALPSIAEVLRKTGGADKYIFLIPKQLVDDVLRNPSGEFGRKTGENNFFCLSHSKPWC